jgi:hypothetical protein
MAARSFIALITYMAPIDLMTPTDLVARMRFSTLCVSYYHPDGQTKD